jgi:glyoxylase-like metal-dependent hydrolase (beta-lactamase superfamily II)
VRHIILTHLDFDHAGGLDDFPHARVHLMRQERDDALAQRTWLDRQRFRPQQWTATRHHWTVHEPHSGESWFGFEGVRPSAGLPQDVLLVPLPGHTMGHAGVAVSSEGRWLMLAGDAYFHHREMDLQSPWCTPGLRLYQTLMEKNRHARLTNQARLRDLKRQHGDMVDIFSSHDTLEFDRLQADDQPLRHHAAA